MTTTETPNKLWTSDDLFALRPSKRISRWIFRGELKESKVTRRNPSHSATVVNVSRILSTWVLAQTQLVARV